MRYVFFLIFIVFLGAFLRLVLLDKNPRILNRDEAALGYNAYLLHEKGVDEWGREWPIALESFGDYKLIGYPFLIHLLYYILPVTDVSVRLPSVLAGVGLILLSYFIGLPFLKNSKPLALAFALTVACAPVFIFYSRVAYEANVALCLFLLGLYMIFRQKVSKIQLVISCLIVLCSILTYNTPLILLPFFATAALFIDGKKNIKINIIKSGVLLAIFCCMFILLLPITAKKSEISIFQDVGVSIKAREYYNSFPSPINTVLGNKYVFYLKYILDKTAQSFSPHFLVTEGGNHNWHYVPGWASVYFLSYILGIFGIIITTYGICKNLYVQTQLKRPLLKAIPVSFSEKKREVFLLMTLLVSLVPSIITVDAPHITRSLLFIGAFLLFSCIGLQTLMRKQSLARLVLLGYTGYMLLVTAIYMNDYLYRYPEYQTKLFDTTYTELVVKTVKDNPDTKIAVVDPQGYFYITTAWYLRLSADEFFSTIVKQAPNELGFKYGERVGNIHFVTRKDDRERTQEPMMILIPLDKDDWEVVKF